MPGRASDLQPQSIEPADETTKRLAAANFLVDAPPTPDPSVQGALHRASSFPKEDCPGRDDGAWGVHVGSMLAISGQVREDGLVAS